MGLSPFTDGQSLHGEAAAVLKDRHICLVSSGRDNQVGHFLENVDVGECKHPVGIGVGMTRLENGPSGARIDLDVAGARS